MGWTTTSRGGGDVVAEGGMLFVINTSEWIEEEEQMECRRQPASPASSFRADEIHYHMLVLVIPVSIVVTDSSS